MEKLATMKTRTWKVLQARPVPGQRQGETERRSVRFLGLRNVHASARPKRRLIAGSVLKRGACVCRGIIIAPYLCVCR